MNSIRGRINPLHAIPTGVFCQNSRDADYSVSKKETVKVLDFIQFGGPDLTVASTIFELPLAL